MANETGTRNEKIKVRKKIIAFQQERRLFSSFSITDSAHLALSFLLFFSSNNLLELRKRSSVVGTNEVLWEVFLLESVGRIEFYAGLEIVLSILETKQKR